MANCPRCRGLLGSNSNTCPTCGAPIPALSEATREDLNERVIELLAQGQKIEAVKLYREVTGSNLLDAKTAVEALESTRRIATIRQSTDAELQSEILRLLGERKKIQAVKLYQQKRGGTLKDAKRAVEDIGDQHGILGGGAGCLGMALLLVVGSALVGWLV